MELDFDPPVSQLEIEILAERNLWQSLLSGLDETYTEGLGPSPLPRRLTDAMPRGVLPERVEPVQRVRKLMRHATIEQVWIE